MIPDVHILLALRAGFKSYLASAANFRLLFPHMPDGASDVVDQWYAAIQADPPALITSTPQGVEDLPAITVGFQGETIEDVALGDFLKRDSNGREVMGMMAETEVTLSIYAPSPSLARGLHVLTRATVLAAQEPLLQAGYLGCHYQGSSGLDPVPELTAEDGGIWRITQRWSIRHQVEARPVSIPLRDKWWFVLDEETITSATADPKQPAPVNETNNNPPHRTQDNAGVAGGVKIKR